MRIQVASPALLATFTIALTASPAVAQEATVTRYRPGPVALFASLGWYDGAAVGAEVRLGAVGARLTGGGNLTMLTVSNADDLDIDSFHVFAGGQANADLYAYPLRFDNGFELGISAAARYNTVLGIGYGGALEGRRQINPRLGIDVAFGITFFPDGEDRMVENEGFSEDAEFNFPFGAGLQSGFRLALTYDLL